MTTCSVACSQASAQLGLFQRSNQLRLCALCCAARQTSILRGACCLRAHRCARRRRASDLRTQTEISGRARVSLSNPRDRARGLGRDRPHGRRRTACANCGDLLRPAFALLNQLARPVPRFSAGFWRDLASCGFRPTVIVPEGRKPCTVLENYILV